MKFIKRYKSFFSDMILNMIGFGIYVASQKIILLPILAKNIDDVGYSAFVLYISILNVFCNVTGGELGNVRLVRNTDYKSQNIIGDFSRILLMLSPIILVIAFPILIYLKYSILGSFILILIMLLANVRLYSTCFYRLEQKYNKVIYQNLVYLVGIICSLLIFKRFKNMYCILLVPEILSCIYAFKNSDLLKMKLKKTIEFASTVKKFIQLGFVSLLTNVMNYFDSFLIYPMLGATSVAVYYAVNSMSNVTALVTNPMSSVLLSWVSNADGEDSKKKIIKMTLLFNLPLLILVTLITMPLTYIALKFLYSQYLEKAVSLIFIISVATAFGTCVAFIKSVLLKYSNTNKLVGAYVVYFISLAVLGISLSNKYELVGFTLANMISKIILWLFFIYLLLVSKKENTIVTEDKDGTR